MTQIGYHASHEQFPPSELVRLAVAAEQAGFDCAKSSDHIHPWSERQGHSGFAWSWLGAAMQATSLPCGSIAAPGYRYHPAILAQAAATIGEMFPERFWLALGTGEALNETITGQVWPEKTERNAILAECVEIFRALFAGETVTHRGRVTVVEAKLYSLPANPVPLFGSAVTPATAKFCAGWADGLLTLGGESDKVREVVEAFRAHGGEGKPIHVQHTLSWDTTEAAALASAIDQWGPLIAGGDVNWDLRRPRDFDTVGKLANADNIGRSVKVSADLGQHAQWLAELAELGVTAIHLHCVGRNQAAFLDAFGAKVLPQLR